MPIAVLRISRHAGVEGLLQGAGSGACLDVRQQVAVCGGGGAGRLVLVADVRDDGGQLVHSALRAQRPAERLEQLLCGVALPDVNLQVEQIQQLYHQASLQADLATSNKFGGL